MTDRARSPRTEVEIRAEALGGSALARAALASAVPSHWYERCPRTPGAWRERSAGARDGVPGDWARRLAPALAASGAAAARLARVADGRGVVVTTGQQPGLFGGPLYTWFKALSALALADELETTTGIPTAPVFWAATDDADFAEAAETWVASDGGARRLALDVRDTGGRPMAEVPLGGMEPQHDALAEAAGSGAHADVLALARSAYAPEETVGGAYVRLLRALLEPLGIAVLDAAHDAVRDVAAPVLRRALLDAADVERHVRERTAEVAGAGYAPQVALVDGLSLVSARDASGAKVRVPIADAARVGGDDRAALGATVLLRPVLERAILPTVAYVAGPGEIAYFAQVGAVAQALDLPRPLAVPRWSATLVEPRVRRVLDRLRIADAALEDPHAPERELAAALMPADVAAALAAMRAAVERDAASLRAAGDGLVPDAVTAGFLRDQQARLDRLERRYRAAVRRREADRFRDLATARGALRPGGLRQERALNLLPLLVRHGPALLDDVRDAARAHAASLATGAAADGGPTVRPAAAGA